MSGTSGDDGGSGGLLRLLAVGDFGVCSEALCSVVDAYDSRFGFLPEPPPPPS